MSGQGDEREIVDHIPVFKKLKTKPENKICFDCGQSNPTWASIPFGVFICLECASHHRNLGVHISFCRSTNLDKWTGTQLKHMILGGNQAAKAYFTSHGEQELTGTNKLEKYKTRTAGQYRTKLSQLVAKQGDTALSSIGVQHVTSSPPKKDVTPDDAHMKFENLALEPHNVTRTQSAPTALQAPHPAPAPVQQQASIPEGTSIVGENKSAADAPAAASAGTGYVSMIGGGSKRKSSKAKKANRITIDDSEFDQAATIAAKSKAPAPVESSSVTSNAPLFAEPQKPIDSATSQFGYVETASPKKSLSAMDQVASYNANSFFDSELKNSPVKNQSSPEKTNTNAPWPMNSSDGDAASRFGSAKAISSDMFNSAPVDDSQARAMLAQYGNAQAISSDMIYGRDRTSSVSSDGSASEYAKQLASNLKDKSKEIGSKVGHMVGSVAGKVAEKYGRSNSGSDWK